VCAETRERAGAIVVRVWIEPGADHLEGLRARITSSPDLSSAGQTVQVVSGREEILAAVRTWLDRFLTDSASK
jgi:hypothetical protein